jgi:hypothetical protein
MRARGLVVACAAVAMTLSGCASKEPAEQTPGTTTTGHGSLAHCLSEHGVPAAPGPTAGPPPGVNQDTWHRAMQACSTLAPGPAS